MNRPLIQRCSFPIEYNGKVIGTGFKVSEEGYAITCKHIVKDDDGNERIIEVGGAIIPQDNIIYPESDIDVVVIKIPDNISVIYEKVCIDCDKELDQNMSLNSYGFGEVLYKTGIQKIYKVQQLDVFDELGDIDGCRVVLNPCDENQKVCDGDSGSALYFENSFNVVVGIIQGYEYDTNMNCKRGIGISIKAIIPYFKALQEILDQQDRKIYSFNKKIHITSLFINRDALEIVLKPFLEEDHDYEVTISCADINGENDGFDGQNNTKIEYNFIFLIGPEYKDIGSDDERRYIDALERDYKNALKMNNSRISIICTGSKVKNDQIDKKISQIYSLAKSRVGKKNQSLDTISICEKMNIIEGFHEVLIRDVAENIKKMGYLDSISYQRREISPIIPEKDNLLYIHSACSHIESKNIKLCDILRRLFLEKQWISPLYAEYYVSQANENIEIYVNRIICGFLEKYSNEYSFFATDYIIGWDEKFVWMERSVFRNIMLKSLESYYKNHENQYKFSRIYILPVKSASEFNDLFNAQPNITKLLLLQLAINTELYFVREEEAKKYLFKGDFNFFLAEKKTVGAEDSYEEKLAIMDIRFPYIRLYNFTEDDYVKLLGTNDVKENEVRDHLQKYYLKIIKKAKDELGCEEHKFKVESDLIGSYISEIKNKKIRHLMTRSDDNESIVSRDGYIVNDSYKSYKDCTLLEVFKDVLDIVRQEDLRDEMPGLLKEYFDSLRFHDIETMFREKIIKILKIT